MTVISYKWMKNAAPREKRADRDTDLKSHILGIHQLAELLGGKKLTGSHSRHGNSYDNTCIEWFFSHLKTEKLYLEKPQNLAQARSQITEYIYNMERFQNKLGDLSPIVFREKVPA